MSANTWIALSAVRLPRDASITGATSLALAWRNCTTACILPCPESNWRMTWLMRCALAAVSVITTALVDTDGPT
ncbi:hypothetical protein D3C80_1482480 [compost metagenome]